MPVLVQQCLDAASLILFTAAVAARVWLSRHNRSYCCYRTAFAAANRVAHSVYMLTVFTQMDVEGWADFVLHRKPGVTPPVLKLPAAAAAVVKGLFSTGVFWAMHALLFPFRLSAAGPLHAAFCLAAWPALRGLACMVYADAALSAGARLVCARLQSVSRVALNTLGVGGDMWDAEEDSTCSARPMEFLVPIACAFTCLAMVSILYERELAHKLAYLRRRSRGSAAAACDAGEQPVPVRRLAMAAALLLMALSAGDVAAEWAPPYQCAAA
ncbi:MAG: hypothetical protein J3K34DRAFT_415792 [Monoraphidium minutum]|nr:MAG: hypothetical protein J3K34DRAFT_415792 [Monoraphidium minutum]